MTKETQITKDLINRTITVRKRFLVPPEQLWKAWTTGDILEQWWAPKPWRAETKEMDFQERGHWLYAMVGPDDTRHWAIINYIIIDAPNFFSGIDSFSDENGNISDEMPAMTWNVEFIELEGGTELVVKLEFKTDADLLATVEMGFEEGFASALTNLEQYLTS